MGYKINRLPDGVGVFEAFNTLIANVESGGAWSLPAGYDVQWRWRNAPHLPLRTDEFRKTVVDSSRGGFRDLMIERLKADRDRIADRVAELFPDMEQERSNHAKSTKKVKTAIRPEIRRRRSKGKPRTTGSHRRMGKRRA